MVPFLLKTSDNPEGLEQKVFDEFIEKLLEDRPAFLANFGKLFFGETLVNHPLSQPQMDWAHSLTLVASPKATIDCVTSFSATDFRNDLKKISLPTLIIHGSSDKIVPIEISSDKTATMIPGAVYKVYENAPHGLFITHKDDLNAHIEEFVKIGKEETVAG